MKLGNKLFNWGFITLNIFILFSFCNLAVFYDFYNYLELLQIPIEWRGGVIGIFSVSALIFRPIISLFLTPRHAVKSIAIGLILIVTCLCLYSTTSSLYFLILLRIFHGAAYVLLMSSSVILLMVFMPPENSGQGFSIISIMTLLPYAVVPLVLESGYLPIVSRQVYSYMAFLILPCAFLLIPLSMRARDRNIKDKCRRNDKEELCKQFWMNLRHPRVSILLLVNGLVFLVYALVFYFLKAFFGAADFGDVGLFFTISTLTMIIVRIAMGSSFDIYNKALMGMLSLFIFAVSLLFLGYAAYYKQFYCAAIMYGMGIGAATPLLNSLMFVVSKPEYRGVNANLMLEMVDLGFFAGPFVGGLAVSAGLEKEVILTCCAGLIMLTASLLIPFLKISHMNIKAE
ncbi:MAG: MFS transporter [Desulfobacter sp.]|nr:MAG: MFS transporter [Desulfobacter sp.]